MSQDSRDDTWDGRSGDGQGSSEGTGRGDGQAAGRTSGHTGDHDGAPRDVDAEFAALTQGLAASEPVGSKALAEESDPDQGDDGHEEARPAGRGQPDRADDLWDQPDQAGGSQAPRAVKVAVVVTPVASAQALAALCAVSDLECIVVPSTSGALAVRQLVSAHEEWDISELVGGADTEPAEAAELAASLSRVSRAGVVLMTADLATDVGIESGLSGTVTARRYVEAEAGEEASAGLLLASMDQVVEDVLLGVTPPQDVPGAVRSTEVRPSRAMRWLGRGLRRPPRS
ncbi:hypothetical protein [Actinomyces lilanjuaniae]|uniref:hypothetical protein n=1 Tax=Actinomyces lilanjuaniae TaxID=2321394 RepID=UPI001FAAA712|nr:hypothetical protein [Actinomyces lilanjuaniae]